MARQAEFKVSRLARLSGVPLRTLQRHFQKHHKMAVTEWMREVRLGEARIRLLAGGRIKEVAYDLGFKQLSHFSRAFKKQFGIAPSLLAQPCEQSKITAGEFRDSMLDAGSRPR
jgi:AraC family chitin signaling transcriptional activator